MDTTPVDLGATVKRPATLSRKVVSWTVILLLYAGAIALAWFGARSAWKGLAPGLLVAQRLDRLGLAVILLAFPALLAKILIVNKMQKGRFFAPRQVKIGEMATCSIEGGVRRCSPPGRLRISLTWANIEVRSSEAATWKRVVAGAVLLLAGVGLVALVAMAVVCFIAGIAIGGVGILLCTLLALLCLFFPLLVTWQLVQRKRRTGSLRSSAEDLYEMRRQQSEWTARQAAQPLRTKLIGVATVSLVLAWLWLRNWERRSHDPAWWTQPAMFTAFACFGLVQQFRRPKSATAGD